MVSNKRDTDARDGPVKSLTTTFAILDRLHENDGGRVTELATELGVSKSSIHDHLRTLEANDFVTKDEENRYRVSLRFLDYGGYARRQLNIYRFARPELEKLANETGEIVNLAVEEHGMGIYIDIVRGSEAVNLDTYVGRRDPLHSTAFGKAILAHLPQSRVDEILERRGLPAVTDRTITSRGALEERLDEIRERGYAIDRGERLERLRCLSYPVKDSDGNVQAAVSVSGPSSRLEDGRLLGELADRVEKARDIIEVNATYG